MNIPCVPPSLASGAGGARHRLSFRRRLSHRELSESVYEFRRLFPEVIQVRERERQRIREKEGETENKFALLAIACVYA